MNPLRLAYAPMLLIRQTAELIDRADRILAVAANLERIGQDANRNAERLVEVGEANVAAGAEMVELARANIEGNRETNEAMRRLDARMAEVLRFAAVLEDELPALRALGDAAPPVQAAAARVERIAGRIPGVRSDG